ncbi:alanine--tRNA ligase [Candidatus Gribaldobacteria bacterium]|nr:alanine--tRNA ligase [Candidatus Gribaldobacteria bacterium]
MKANEIRKKYLEFFEKKGHKIIPSGSLVPQNDPTVLFTTAGMHPLVPYLLGEKHPLGNRLCNSQKCIRTGDVDEVGDNTHLTFFEMLGNWSLGDYFKKEAIEWSFQFLTEELKIPLQKLAFSVFEGEKENNIPRDEEAAQIWQGLGVKPERIVFLGREDNWWGPAGKTGPCGPDTEMFYWVGQEKAPDAFDPSDKRWVEIWNDVFMQYNRQIKNQKSKIKNINQGLKTENKKEEYEFATLKQKNVDTGMGLERITAILQGKDNVFETELFEPIISKIKSQIANFKSKSQISNIEKEKAIRIIADHVKAAVFILFERVEPSNTERGYILRRLIRRAIRYGKILEIQKNFTSEIAKEVIKIYKDTYSEIQEGENYILKELNKEEEAFNKTVERGLKEFERLSLREVSGETAFLLYQSYGFPIEMTQELAKEKGLELDLVRFKEELKKHQALSRTATAGQFKAGLSDNSEQTTKYHTTTHLLLAALRDVLKKPIEQRGSNITAERIRFDFNFERKLTQEEIRMVESWVNDKIKEGLPVICQEMPLDKAVEKGALASFREKYPEIVKVYTICKDFNKNEGLASCEICSGPHIKNTAELGNFKIIKEESSSSGVRRIKAVLQE